MSLEKQLIEALISRDDNDEVDLNVTDALLNIAHAINRLAIVHEKAQDRAAAAAERFESFLIASVNVSEMSGRRTQ